MADEQSHEVQIEEIRSVDNPETKYRAVCTRCGAVSSWFQNKGLAKSNLNKYPCEVKDMEPLKLSDFDSETEFIQACIKRCPNPEQVESLKKPFDFARIKRLMACAKELAQIAQENNLCFWTYSHYDGKAVVGVSWGAAYSQLNMETDGDDWVERPVTHEDVFEALRGAKCK